MLKKLNKTDYAHQFFENAEIYLSNKPSIKISSQIVTDLLGIPNGKQILDIGCGDGSLSMQFLEANAVTFLDFSTTMLKEVKNRIPKSYLGNAKLLNVDFEKHHFEESFDIILCVGVLAHVRDWKSFLDKVFSISSSNGFVILQISNINHLYYRFKSRSKVELGNYGYSLNKISPDLLKRYSSSKGVEVVKIIKYPAAFQFIRVFGLNFTYQFLRLVSKSRMLQFIGTEDVILLKKNAL